jgi:REP element-mobilizing transposase RayT
MMSECLFQDCYRIPTTRATWHDYNAGEYFITICTQNKKPYFGKIVGGRMIFSKIGQFADEQCRNIQMHHAYATIPLWVVMPNHMHAVVVIDNRKIPYEKRNVELSRRHVETFQETSLQRESIKIATEMQSWLSIVVRQLKQSITRFAKNNNIPFAWQSRFHDHIIRNNDDRNAIAEYIENNVVKWEYDKFYC